jgi:hypothetical protein
VIQHTEAVKARIESIPAFASATFVGDVPRTATGELVERPYIAVHPADGIDTQERFTGGRRTQHPRFTLHVVGDSYTNVATITRDLKARFISRGVGIPLEVPGETTRNLHWSSPEPIQWDRDVTPPVAYQVIELSFDSDPA